MADFTDNPISKGNNGNTPIHFAGFTETPNAANNQGKTPIYHAKRNNHLEVVWRVSLPLYNLSKSNTLMPYFELST